MKLRDRSLYLATTLSCLWLFYPNTTTAQIVPDTTLPNNSIAIPNGNSIRIEGGTSTGGNLFHSFQEFSVPIGNEAFFNNGLDIQNIFSRVTGKNISNIDGVIRANGTANLFIINPNGIIFGANAQLNIGGSFIGSTASSIRFVDGSEFSASNPTAPSLLTINVPVGLQFGENPGRIVNRSQAIGPTPTLPPLPVEIPVSNKLGLAVNPGQTLALIGGDIQLEGGILTAYTGQILLGSVKSPGLVQFEPTALGLNLNYANIPNFGNIEINSSLINTSGLGGGKVDIRGGNVTLNGARIYGLTLGNIDGQGVNINAQNLRVQEGSQISTLTLGDGSGSDINIRATDSVEMIGLGIEGYQRFYTQFVLSRTLNPFDPQIVLATGTFGSGAAGNINIDSGRLLVRDGVAGGTTSLGAGNSGNLNIRANNVEIVSSVINNGTGQGGTGQGGTITVDAQRLIMRDGANLLSASLSDGASGNIAIKASESVEMSGNIPESGLQTAIGTSSYGGNGKAGDISVDTKRLTVSNGAVFTLSTGAIFGTILFSTNGGSGGNLTIRASESIEISGVSRVLIDERLAPSGLGANSASSGRGGNIRLSTPVLTLRDGVIISAGSLSAGDAGDITINANRVEVQGQSRIEVSAGRTYTLVNPNATGNAGSLNLNVNQLIVREGGTVSVQSLGTGRAGNLNVEADSIALDNKASIDGTTSSGGGSNINLQAQNIQLRDNSQIGTDAGNSTGGNIDINTNTLVALENSDITANAVRGAGGRVTITAQGIFGIQFRDALTPQSDITATSELGPQFSGTVEINTPDVDPSSGLVEISGNLADVTNQIASACPASGGNSFTVTGRGGLPVDPTQTLPGRTVWRDVRSIAQGETGRSSSVPRTNYIESIAEATAWKIDRQGRVELVANDKEAQVSNPWNRDPSCGV